MTKGPLIIASTDRLRIRELTLHDIPGWLSVFGDPEIARYDVFEPIGADTAEEDVRQELATYWNADPMDPVNYAIESLDGSFLGILYQERHGARSCRIGYHLVRKHWGSGYAREAVAAFIRYLYNERGVWTVTAGVDSRNARSIKLLQGLSFSELQATGTDKVVKGEAVRDLEFALSLGPENLPSTNRSR